MKKTSIHLLSFLLAACVTLPDLAGGQTPDKYPEPSRLDRGHWQDKLKYRGKLRVRYPEGAGVRLGQGWDTSRGEALVEDCVEGGSTPIKIQPQGGKVDVSYTDVLDETNLVLTMTASVSGSYGAASGSGSYRKSVKVDTEKRNIYVSVEVMQDADVIAPTARELQPGGPKHVSVWLQPGPKATLAKADGSFDPEGFRTKCGDMYVYAILKGGFFEGLLNYMRKVTEIQEDINASAQGGGAGYSASGSLDIGMKKRVAHKDTRVDLIVSGGGLSVPQTGEEFLAKLNTWPGEVATAQREVFVLLAPYTSSFVGDWPQTRLQDVPADVLQRYEAHAYRLDALGKFYETAGLDELPTYAPFHASDADVRDVGRVLTTAGKCLQGLARYCTGNADCKLRPVVEANELGATFCSVLSPRVAKDNEWSESELSEMLRTAWPRRWLEELRSDAGFRSRNAALVQRLDADMGPATAEDLRDTRLPSTRSFYQALATAPLVQRVKSGAGTIATRRSPFDQSKWVEYFCTKSLVPPDLPLSKCQSVVYGELVKGDAMKFPEDAKEIHRKWIRKTRLLPVRRVSCPNIDDEMCLSTAAMDDLYRTLNPQFGPAHGYAEVTVPKPVPPKRKKPPSAAAIIKHGF